MEANDTTISTEREPSRWLGDLWRIGIILMIALATRCWVMRHTEVLSRDSIAFIRFALQLETPPEGKTRIDVLKANPHPPGYPVALLAVSYPVRECMSGTNCDSMVRSAQLTSILAAWLLVFPIYFMGKLLFGRETAFIATLLYQLLPVYTQVTSDGLSDGLYILMATTALWFGALGLRRGGAGWFAGAGLFAGLAYLVRPEGLIVVFALGVVFLGLRIRGVWTWRPMLIRSFALAAGLLVAGGPYVAIIGKLSNKPTAGDIMRGEDHPTWNRDQSQNAAPGVNVPLAEWWNSENEKGIFSHRSIWAVKALTMELLKTSFYVLPLFALLGLFWMRSCIYHDAAIALLVILAGLYLLMLWVVGSRAGYVAERHTLLIVLCGSYFAATAMVTIGAKLRAIPSLAKVGSASLWTGLIVVALVAAAIPGGMKPLHANRAGHRAAGLWIAKHRYPKDFIVDPFAWAEFYAGQIRQPASHGDQISVFYAVIEGPGNLHPRLHVMALALKIKEHGKLVYYWPENVAPEKAKVFVYYWDSIPAREIFRDDLPPQVDELAGR